MEYKPHHFFRKSQHSVAFELPNDVFYDLMSTLKGVNLAVDKAIGNGYRITGDDLICLALEDFLEKYRDQLKSLLKRLGVDE